MDIFSREILLSSYRANCYNGQAYHYVGVALSLTIITYIQNSIKDQIYVKFAYVCMGKELYFNI